MSESTSPKRVFVFDSMRTRSHLFFRYLSTNKQLSPVYHPYIMASYMGAERWAKHAQTSPLRKKEIMEDMLPLVGDDTLDSCAREYEKVVANADRAGLTSLANEHIVNVLRQEYLFAIHRGTELPPMPANCNITYIPDHIFNSLTPLILIRHPAIQINSVYRSVVEDLQIRPGDEDFAMLVSSHLPRHLFDVFRNQGRQPIVLDGDDVLWRTKKVSHHLSVRLGLDPTQFAETWEPWPEEQRNPNPAINMFMNTIYASTGIERPDATPEIPQIDDMVDSWVSKYGRDEAEKLKRLVDLSMPHYEYLLQFKA